MEAREHVGTPAFSSVSSLNCVMVLRRQSHRTGWREREGEFPGVPTRVITSNCSSHYTLDFVMGHGGVASLSLSSLIFSLLSSLLLYCCYCCCCCSVRQFCSLFHIASRDTPTARSLLCHGQSSEYCISDWRERARARAFPSSVALF